MKSQNSYLTGSKVVSPGGRSGYTVIASSPVVTSSVNFNMILVAPEAWTIQMQVCVWFWSLPGRSWENRNFPVYPARIPPQPLSLPLTIIININDFVIDK